MNDCALHGTQLSNMRRLNVFAGWQFLLKRCSRSTALQIEFTPENAENMLNALTGAKPFPMLDCIEDMRVTIPETEDTVGNAAVLVAFSALAMACKNTQVCGMLVVRATVANVTFPISKAGAESQLNASNCIPLPRRISRLQQTETLMPLQVAVFTCHDTIALPPFAALRHLILSTASSAEFPIAYLKNAIALETLSLGIFGDYVDWSLEDIDLSSLHALKHVRIEKFAPRELCVPDGCLLHVIWDDDRTSDSKFRQWVDVQSLWQAQHYCLGSLQVYLSAGTFQMDNTTALKSLLTCDQELTYISLWLPELGDEKHPFFVNPGSCQMLALAERVHLNASKACSIRVVDMRPKWKNLSIDAARVILEVEDTAALVHSLDSFHIKGVTTLGFSSLTMMHELHRLDRKCFVNRQTRERAEDNPEHFEFGTLLNGTTLSKFEKLMHCACSSCLPCLSWEGKLSRDSEGPGDCWYVPIYKF